MGTKDNDMSKITVAMEALKKNNMNSFFAADHHELKEIIKGILNKGSVISCGGSATLEESGALELMHSDYFKFLDRSAAKTPEEIKEVYIKTYSCDGFFTSANAITEDGELYNVDGNANRISAIAYGPKKVIVIAGVNKIVRNLNEAAYRVKTVAAPCNGVRLNTGTPCALTGRCVAVNGKMTEGCKSDNRMCVHYLVTGFQRVKDRVNVILLNENLGY